MEDAVEGHPQQTAVWNREQGSERRGLEALGRLCNLSLMKGDGGVCRGLGSLGGVRRDRRMNVSDRKLPLVPDHLLLLPQSAWRCGVGVGPSPPRMGSANICSMKTEASPSEP